MKKRLMVWILLFIMCFSVITFVGCNVDKGVSNTTESGKEVCGTPSIIKTMVAKVVEAQGGGIRVSGLSDGFSDEYTFEAAHTVVYGKETVSAPAKLSVGDTIMIEYTGNILKIYPGKIEDVLCVVILDDIDSPESEKTLIAEVTATDGNGNIYVRGLGERLNSEYFFSCVGANVYAYNKDNSKDTAAEISKGDLIMVKFSGFIEETYPGRPSGVTDVIKLAPSAASSGTGKASAAKNTAVEYKAAVSYAGWTDESLIVSGALNRDKASEIGTCDMAGWIIAVEVEDGTVHGCISFDADFVNSK